MIFSNKLIKKLKTAVVSVQIFLLIYLVTILLLSGYIIELIKELRIFRYYSAEFCNKTNKIGKPWHFM